MLSLVLAPLGLPVDAVLVLFIVIDPVIGPVRVLAIVHTACAVMTLIMPSQRIAKVASVESNLL
jgi:proton glutamate symport protein